MRDIEALRVVVAEHQAARRARGFGFAARGCPHVPRAQAADGQGRGPICGACVVDQRAATGGWLVIFEQPGAR